jgi:hypothetical protein
MKVSHDDPGRQTMLGHMLLSVMGRALAAPGVRLSGGSYAVRFEVSGMVSTVAVEGGEMVISSSSDRKTAAYVKSDLVTLLALARGGSVIGAFLRGRVQVGGNIFRLLPFMRLMRLAGGGS